MKRGIAFVLILFLLSFVSAQFFDDYNSFSITGFFDSIGSQDLILLTSFIIIFAFLFFVLTRINLFRDAYGQPNKAIPGIISFAISMLSVYGIYRSGFDLEGLFSGFGLSAESLYPLIWIVLIAAAVFIIWAFGKRKEGFSFKRGFGWLLSTSGLFILGITIFTDLIYEKGIALVIGVILFLIGLLLWKKARSGLKVAGKFVRRHYPRKSGTLVLVLGVLVIVFGWILSQYIIVIIGIIVILIGILYAIKSVIVWY